MRHDDSAEQVLCLLLCDAGRFSGAGASLLQPELGLREGLAATDPTFEMLAEMQFTLWEGPGPEAFNTGEPVVGDVRTDSRRWPILTAEVGRKGLVVQALAVVPLVYDATTIGLVGAYRSSTETITDTDVHLLTTYGHAIAATVVQRTDQTEGNAAVGSEEEPVAAAIGMLVSYMGISLEEAVARLRAHAFSTGVTLTELASALCRRRVPLSEMSREY